MDYDLAIIGAGWAGYNAAIKAKKTGLKVALIEGSQVGGTCLNQGCIPTKTLIQSAKTFALIQKAATFGISSGKPHINFIKIQERKDGIIRQLRQGMASQLKGVDLLTAQARLLSPDTIEAGYKQLKSRSIILATGSRPVELKNLKFDGKRILNSDQILDLRSIPKDLLIIGGGVIGCEFASLFSILGSNVSIAEKMPQILPGEDIEIAKKLAVIFKKKGIKVHTSTESTSLDLSNYDLVLVCIGRTPRTEDLGLEKAGVKLENTRIAVDDYLRTSRRNIYAAGDCTSKTMLAHFAAYQGIIAAENIANPDHPKLANNNIIPNCIFTAPEISSIGLSQEKATQENLDFKVYKFDFLESGMARIINETEGFIKILCDRKTDVILGASIIGPRATELISVLAVALQGQLKLSQIRATILPHPTLSESIVEALK